MSHRKRSEIKHVSLKGLSVSEKMDMLTMAEETAKMEYQSKALDWIDIPRARRNKKVGAVNAAKRHWKAAEARLAKAQTEQEQEQGV